MFPRLVADFIAACVSVTLPFAMFATPGLDSILLRVCSVDLEDYFWSQVWALVSRGLASVLPHSCCSLLPLLPLSVSQLMNITVTEEEEILLQYGIRKAEILPPTLASSSCVVDNFEMVSSHLSADVMSLVDTLPVLAKTLIAGGAAGAVAKTAVAPLTRTNDFRSLGVSHSLKKVLQCDGPLGFYKGNGASVIRIIPYAALHYMTYEVYRDWILENNLPLGSGPVVDLVAGSAAGGTAVLCTYPLDLARTKLAYQVSDTGQSFRGGTNGFYRQPPYSGIREVLTMAYKEGGPRGLYRSIGKSCLH
ncbi:hypothetical protein F2Q68_00013400 [Brassica cretica]|uniref:Mitochondrial carrier protein n=1 Tax=Brassica cretica TaxID=69181 RepID=A0A8S9HZ33_BRACR|nr:hypothetical protein F2Q68_00013400 [Brassica cretica]